MIKEIRDNGIPSYSTSSGDVNTLSVTKDTTAVNTFYTLQNDLNNATINWQEVKDLTIENKEKILNIESTIESLQKTIVDISRVLNSKKVSKQRSDVLLEAAQHGILLRNQNGFWEEIFDISLKYDKRNDQNYLLCKDSLGNEISLYLCERGSIWRIYND